MARVNNRVRQGGHPVPEPIIKKEENAGLLASKADAAFLQAARKVIQVALQTGTLIVVWEEGRVKEISAERVDVKRLATKIEEVRA